ncbi:MAG TPA: MFS transporter [Alphaproteobacteria bacterium]|jgi:AAHS family 4-hydroxybenzoate transporter-like MFS transporter
MTSGKTINVTEAIDRNRVSRFQILVIVLCGFVAVLDGFDTQAIAFVAPVIAAQWGIETSSFGSVFGAGLLGLMAGALIFGPIADRVGRKLVIVVSTIVFGVFALLTATAGSIDELLLYRVLTGIGLGGAMPNIIALTSEYAPARLRATLVTIMFCGFPFGAVLGGAIAAQIIPDHGWQSVFVLGGVLPLLLAAVLLPALPESIRFLVARGRQPERAAAIMRRIDRTLAAEAGDSYVVAEQSAAGAPVAQLFAGGRAGVTILLWIVFFMNLLMMYFLINWLPTVLAQAGLPVERAIIATVLLNLGGIIGGLALGRLIDRRGPYRVLATAYLGAAVFTALIGVADISVGAIMATVFVTGFCIIGAQFGMNALAADYYPTAVRSTGVGWALGIGRIGSILGPVIGGLLLALEWPTSSLFLAAALPALISVAAVVLIGLSAARTRSATVQAPATARL